MLILTLKDDNEIHIGEEIVIRLAGNQYKGADKVRIAIEAPQEFGIYREPNQLNAPSKKEDA